MRRILILLCLLIRLHCNGLDAKTYGAKGDGIQDDSYSLNGAIAKALSLGEDLFIPAGIYKCDQPGSGFKILRMDQIGIKKIRIYGEIGTKITTSQLLGCLFYIYYKNTDVVIEKIFFENTHAITESQTNGIQLLGTNENAITNFTIQNCRFEGFSTAILAQGVKGLTIQNNYFESTGGHDGAQNNSQPAVFIWLADNSNGQCYDVKILNNNVNGYTGNDISQTITKRPMDGFVFGIAYGIRIEGNTTQNLCEEHIFLQPLSTYPDLNYETLIAFNQLNLSIPSGSIKAGIPLLSNYGVRTDCNNVIIEKNDFYNYSLGILIWPFAYQNLKQHDYTVSGNKFYSSQNALYDVREAIKIQSSPTNHAYNIMVAKNLIDIDNVTLKSSRSVISVYDCENVKISNNTISGKNINLNGFSLSGLLIQNCLNVVNENNTVMLK
jgi:hypothetical protein